MEISLMKLFRTISYTPWSPQLTMNELLFEYTLTNFEYDYRCKSLWSDFKSRCDMTYGEFCEIYNGVIQRAELVNELDIDLSQFDTDWCNLSEHNKDLEYGRVYLSLDMYHSYSQMMDKLNIFPMEFDDLINDSISHPVLKDNKKLRLCFYHTLKFHEDTKHYVTSLFEDVYNSDDVVVQMIKKLNIHQVNVDELVFDITECLDEFIPYIGKRIIGGIQLNISVFTQHRIRYEDEWNKECEIHIREYTTHVDYVSKNCRYLNQLYKAYNNLPISELDLYVVDMNDQDLYYKLPEPIKITEII